MPPKQQRFHGNRFNSMKIGMRGLMFTINPQHEPKAFREIAALVEKILGEYPEELFQLKNNNINKENNNSNNKQDDVDENENEYQENEDQENENDDVNSSNTTSAKNGAGSTFADELQAELEDLKEGGNNQDHNKSATSNMVAREGDNDDGAENNNNKQQRKPRKIFPPRRFRVIDTNCKGFAFVAINFSDELEAADRVPVVASAENENNNTNVITIQQQQVFNFCVGKIPSLILEISKKIVATIRDSDVPLLRFTYYLYPCLSTAAPTVHSAIVLAEAVKVLVPIPKGKSAAKIETHFSVRNNSGMSQPVVLEELKKNFKERLPMGRYFVTNATLSTSGGSHTAAQRRQRENNPDATPRTVNASITYFVLHSAALLCIQLDYSEFKEYALHKLGSSFADSLNAANSME
jgi:hypothetical protein